MGLFDKVGKYFGVGEKGLGQFGQTVKQTAGTVKNAVNIAKTASTAVGIFNPQKESLLTKGKQVAQTVKKTVDTTKNIIANTKLAKDIIIPQKQNIVGKTINNYIDNTKDFTKKTINQLTTKEGWKKSFSDMEQLGKDLKSTDPQKRKLAQEKMNNVALMGANEPLKNVGEPLKGVAKNLVEDVGKNLISKGEGIFSKLTKKIEPKLSEVLPKPKAEINLNHLNIDDTAKQITNEAIESIKPKIETKIGSTLSNKEVKELADHSSNILKNAVGREQTKQWESAMLNTRERLSQAAKEGTVTKEFLDDLLTIKSHATDIGRKLQSLNIKADPANITSKETIVDAVYNAGAKADEILKASEGVDFNNHAQASEFYRKFVKPKTSEWVDLLRYNSMLSSPNTHINNAFGNLLNSTLVAPVEKALTGGLDFLSSNLTGKERKYFAGEGGAYLKGYFSNVKEAAQKFSDVLSGKQGATNLDVRNIPLANKGVKGAVYKTLSYPMKMLEASDQFFTTLVKNAEKSALEYKGKKGVNVKNIDLLANDAADYRLFRQGLRDEKQGVVLDAIDRFTGVVDTLRNSDNPLVATIAKYTVPFVKTPMNIFKQGIEYSPAGFFTMIKSSKKGNILTKNATEQLSKAILGSSVFAGAGLLAVNNKLTWGEPTDEKSKQLWRQAGKQPYSIKMGDKWVSFQKLPPALAFPFAMVAGINDAKKNKKIDDGTAEVVLSSIAKLGQFLSDQTYAKSIGDILSAAKGGEAGIARAISNYPQQFIPYRALQGWFARLLDDTQRKVDNKADFVEKQMQLLMTQIPGLSKKVPARLDTEGTPIKTPDNISNAFSPVKISTENKEFSDFLNNYEKYSKQIKDNQTIKQQETEKLKPFYEEVQQVLNSKGREAAKEMIDKLSDEDYEIYKKLKASDSRRQTDIQKEKLYPLVEHVQQLKEEGNMDEAQRIVDELSEEQYRYYKLAKEKLYPK